MRLSHQCQYPRSHRLLSWVVQWGWWLGNLYLGFGIALAASRHMASLWQFPSLYGFWAFWLIVVGGIGSGILTALVMRQCMERQYEARRMVYSSHYY